MPPRNQRKQQIEFKGYVDIKLDETGIKSFKAWRDAFEDMWNTLDRYAENGYRISVAWDDFNETYQCSITTSDPKNDNAGYVLVGRGGTSYSAICQALYKDTEIAKGNWKNFTMSRTQDWD